MEVINYILYVTFVKEYIYHRKFIFTIKLIFEFILLSISCLEYYYILNLYQNNELKIGKITLPVILTEGLELITHILIILFLFIISYHITSSKRMKRNYIT